MRGVGMTNVQAFNVQPLEIIFSLKVRVRIAMSGFPTRLESVSREELFASRMGFPSLPPVSFPRSADRVAIRDEVRSWAQTFFLLGGTADAERRNDQGPSAVMTNVFFRLEVRGG